MAPEEERRGGLESGEGDFEGRDLLVGRPGGAGGRSTADAAATPPATAAASPHPHVHDDAIREILSTVRTTAARIDALQGASDPEHEPAEARALGEAAAALKTQGKALDKRLRTTGGQAEATARATAEMKQAATALDNSLRIHAENMTRMTEGPWWRQWRLGLAIAAASFVFFVLGAVLQREADVVSLGDPHHEWNRFVAERYAPTLAACASRARQHDEAIRCQMRVDPAWDMTIPLHPDVNLEKVLPDEDFDTTTDR